MGDWGSGLYSGDFALDLRSTIAALLRLPFPPDRIVDILLESEPSAANNHENEDHTAFWLVTADQFAKRGIDSECVRQKALAIIDTGQDLAALERRGMTTADLRKRQKMLQQLRSCILAPPAPKKRTVLPKPQAFLMNVGDLLVYPTCGGHNINPYFRSKEMVSVHTSDGAKCWTQDGWGAMLIVDCGRAFDYLVWYRAVSLAEAVLHKPSVEQLLSANAVWGLGSPGTCSRRHYVKLELEKLAALPLNSGKLRAVFPGLRPGIRAAVSDISISNAMSAAPALHRVPIPEPDQRRPGLPPTLRGIGQILDRVPQA